MRARTAGGNEGASAGVSECLCGARRQREQIAVQRVDVVDEPGHGVPVVHPLAAALTKAATEVCVAREQPEPVGESVDVVRSVRGSRPARRATTSLTPPTSVDDHRHAGGKRLDHGDRRALVRRRQRDRVDRRVHRSDVVAEAGEVRRARRSRARRPARSSALRSGPSPTSSRSASTPAARSRRERVEQLVDALDLGHPAEPADQERGRPGCRAPRARPRARPAELRSARRDRARAGSR